VLLHGRPLINPPMLLLLLQLLGSGEVQLKDGKLHWQAASN
jgi:hypothetical protein